MPAHAPAFLAYAAAVGWFASAFAGAVGIGAVLLMAPLLFFGGPFFGVALDFKAISNLTTFTVVIAAMRAIFIYRGFGLVRREVIVPMAIPACIFAALGVTLAGFASAAAEIQIVFAIASLVGGAFLLIPYQRELDDAQREIHPKPQLYALSASVVGFIGGFAGAGGGFLLIPTLMGLFRLPTRIAIGTASFTGLIIALVAFVGRVALLHVDWVLVAVTGIGALAGTEMGTRFQQKVPTLVLRRAVVCVVGISAVRLLVQLH